MIDCLLDSSFYSLKFRKVIFVHLRTLVVSPLEKVLL